MSMPIIKSSLLILSLAMASNLTYSSSLVEFGKKCLVKEDRLNKAQNRLEALSLRAERKQRRSNRSIDRLDRYQAEKELLEIDMAECSETTPNSAFCHQVRLRFHEIAYLIQSAKTDSVGSGWGGNDAITDYEITKDNFNRRYDDFLALCRDSNAHYALIQTPEAYAEVCSSEAAKQSVTCTLF
ncbi:hypothetical protein [Marinomonas foliarum]|uniref:Lysozyme inhibitor LprI N-terminal domain-containing protein n=2 Tax=Marinomonas foliarum TaxID=491950 RepID=A0A368ZU60_9GAMM|nr:hypothetical protein [Marinomonas foliarum]RCX00515.1 hypothetical protein DFP77_12114 [Marinomonas foliarum]